MLNQSSLPARDYSSLKLLSLFTFLLLACASVAAQDKVSIQGAPTNQPTTPGPAPGPEPISPMVRSRPDLPLTPISPARPASVEELKAKVHRLQAANAELQAINARTEADLGNIGRHAIEIHELALYLRTGLGLRTESILVEARPSAVDDPLQHEILAIDRSTTDLISNPASQQPHTVDAQLLTAAVSDLNELISSSSRLEQFVADRMSPKSRKALAKLHAEVNGASPLLQLDLECDLWSTDSFAARPGAVAKSGTMTIEKVKLDVRHHTLAHEEVIPLGNCAAHGREQRKDETYSATIKDFNSYQAKGRVVFYQATYRILLSKNGKTTRAAEPLYLYYIDWSGQGRFELDTSGRPLQTLPDWFKEVTAQH